jgi:alpha-L-rhamnosidase
VLSFFSSYQKPGGSLGYLPWWQYLDWAKEWRDGDPPTETDGFCAPFDLQLILAYDWAAELEEALGLRSLALEWRRAAAELRNTARSLYWNSSLGLFADTPNKKNYSQQTNVLAILAGLAHGKDASALIKRILTDKSLVQCTYYFQHYLHTALLLAGEGDRYLDLLGEWYQMLDRGLTTWAETPETTGNYSRSDCHAWSAHPNLEFFRTVLGIRTAAPGFSRVEVRPNLGNLKNAYGSIPHPKGEVVVELSLQGSALEATVNLPQGVEGEFVWRGHRHKLAPGPSGLSL